MWPKFLQRKKRKKTHFFEISERKKKRKGKERGLGEVKVRVKMRLEKKNTRNRKVI